MNLLFFFCHFVYNKIGGVMETFFVVDSIKYLKNNIEIIRNNIGDSIKFFVKTKLYTEICGDRFIIENLAGLYDNNEIKKIDEYIKGEKYLPKDTVIAYSSVKLNDDLILKIVQCQPYQYDTIYFKKSDNFFTRILKNIYRKLSKLFFNFPDATCSYKLQFISERFMGALKFSRFQNRIMQAKNSIEIDVDDVETKKSLKDDFKFKKYNIYNLIALFLILIGFVSYLTFAKIKFIFVFAFILAIITSLSLSVLLIAYNVFDIRYKNGKK